MSTALMIAGPPTSVKIWTDAAARLSATLPCQVMDLFDPLKGPPTVGGLAAAVAQRLHGLGPDPILVAHGLAVPVALYAAPQVPGLRLVLSNGPIARLDPVSTLLAGMATRPRLMAATILQPSVLMRWLYSSAGLRRAVRNPYVMDRDTVVAICGSLFATRTGREGVARFIGDLPDALRSTPSFDGPALLCWGDEDRLYPPTVVDEARLLLPHLTHHAIAGGRHLHPVERPWEIADMVSAWATSA